MNDITVHQNDDITETIEKYGSMLFRICLIKLGNSSDAEDAVQETFISYFLKKPSLNDDEHKKAWLIKVAVNKCKDKIKYNSNHATVDIDDLKNYITDRTSGGIMDVLMSMPEKLRTVMVLYYVEEFRTEEIAKMIGKTSSAVKMRLKKGRELLADSYKRSENL